MAQEPNDVYRHALCPSMSLRPNAPFQLLRTGRWRCALGGCAHRSILFSSSLGRIRNIFALLYRLQKPGCGPFISSVFWNHLYSGAHDITRKRSAGWRLLERPGVTLYNTDPRRFSNCVLLSPSLSTFINQQHVH